MIAGVINSKSPPAGDAGEGRGEKASLLPGRGGVTGEIPNKVVLECFVANSTPKVPPNPRPGLAKCSQLNRVRVGE